MIEKKMTFQEFKAMALNPPKREEETIFDVLEYAVDFLPGRKRQHYPIFKLMHRTIGLCHSVDDGEKIIRHSVNLYKEEGGYEPYCFYIVEKPVGEYLDYLWMEYGVSAYLYDSCGIQVDRTYCSSMDKDWQTPYGSYFGRPEEGIRFSKGDIVEVRKGDEVSLAIVACDDLPIDHYWKRYLKHGYIRSDDASDEQTTIIDGPGYEYHEHVHTLNLMPLRYPLNKTLRKRYEHFYSEMLRKNAAMARSRGENTK